MFGGEDTFKNDASILDLSLSNIALFTALETKTSILSQGRVFVIDSKSGKEIENDPFIKLINNPNPFQSKRDFFKQLYWFRALGTNVMRTIKIRDNGNSYDVENIKYLNNLVPSCINWKDVNKISKMVMSERDYNNLLDKEIEYTVGDSQYVIKVADLEFFYDISNGMTNNSIFRSESRIKTVIPAIRNIEEAQRAKNINLQFSSKFIATNKTKEAGGYAKNLEDSDRLDIQKAISSKGVIATNAEIDVKSLANNFNTLMYDEGISAEASKIFSVFGMDKDIINWHLDGASTYENKKVAVANWIQGSIQSEADDVANTFTNSIKYAEKGKEVKISFNHLPVMKAIELQRVELFKTQAETIKALVDSGASFESAIAFLGIDNLKGGNGE